MYTSKLLFFTLFTPNGIVQSLSSFIPVYQAHHQKYISVFTVVPDIKCQSVAGIFLGYAISILLL